MEFSETDKRDLDDLTKWAFGESRANGARGNLKEISETLYDKEEGLVRVVKELIRSNEATARRLERRNAYLMGGMVGVLVMLVFLAWQGNQQAQEYLNLLQELKKLIP